MRKTAQIIDYGKINEYINEIKDKKIVLVGGCFDLIHFGHLQFLKKSKENGDYLIVALESDEFIKKNKRKEPVHTQDERAEILAALSFVDLIIKLPLFNNNNEYFQMVKTIKPNIIAVTEGDKQLDNKKKQAEEIKAQVLVVTPLLKKYSTRKIISSLD